MSFQGFVKASDAEEAVELPNQVGSASWSARTHVRTYSSGTLIGNWIERRFDVTKLSQAKPLPSEFDHYYTTTYKQSFSPSHPEVPSVLKYKGEEREVKAFPAHQPILDPAQLKQCYNSFLTTSMIAYAATPQLKGEKQQQEEEVVEEEEVEEGKGGEEEKGQTRVSFCQ